MIIHLQNKAIHDLREILRRQSKKNQSGYEIQEGLIQAIQRIEKQLKVSANALTT